MYICVMALSDKHIRFCKEYVIDFNATNAAIAAGYAEDSARITASRLLTKVNIKDFIKELQMNKSEQLNITFESIALGVHEIATKDDAKDTDRLKAYDQLSKLFGHYNKDNEQKKIDVITVINLGNGINPEE